jgi:hypothetical protein
MISARNSSRFLFVRLPSDEIFHRASNFPWIRYFFRDKTTRGPTQIENSHPQTAIETEQQRSYNIVSLPVLFLYNIYIYIYYIYLSLLFFFLRLRDAFLPSRKCRTRIVRFAFERLSSEILLAPINVYRTCTRCMIIS